MEFEAVYQKGKKIRTNPLMHASLLKRPGEIARLGLVVPKKIGKAVVRNRVKRRLREIFRRNKTVAAQGMDVVLYARPGIQNLDYGELERSYLNLWAGSVPRTLLSNA